MLVEPGLGSPLLRYPDQVGPRRGDVVAFQRWRCIVYVFFSVSSNVSNCPVANIALLLMFVHPGCLLDSLAGLTKQHLSSIRYVPLQPVQSVEVGLDQQILRLVPRERVQVYFVASQVVLLGLGRDNRR